MRLAVWLVTAVQAILALRVFGRMARTARGSRIEQADLRAFDHQGSVAVIVPVLDEAERIEPCLAGLMRQGESVEEILIVDGGSTDGTFELIRQAAQKDARIRLLETGPIPAGVNGKAFGLMRGADRVSPGVRWIMTVDADVRLQPGAIDAIVGFAARHGSKALSVAAAQSVDGVALGLLHPSMLTTLVYRFGIPGHATNRPDRVQANGQCFLVDRNLLERVGGFGSVLGSICEDVTLARRIAASGEPVGFYESAGLVRTEMHSGAVDAWRNWPRSLPMHDRFSGRGTALGLAEIIAVQAAPLWLFFGGLLSRRTEHPFVRLQAILLMARFGVLAGTARAYPHRPWSYWFSPLVDLPVGLEIVRRSRQRTHRWRGRTIFSGEGS